MKKIIYKTIGLTDIFNPDTNEIEQKEIFVTVKLDYSSESIKKALNDSYNGEYTIEDDGEPEPPPTTEQRVSDLEEQLVQADETAIALYEAQETQETINAQQDEALMEIYEMIG